jgi:two-component system, OmpR family, response regulator
MISIRQNYRRRCILVVAQRIEARAQIARLLQSKGYAVELADSQKRALELASAGQIEAAIVIPSGALGGLSQRLRDIIPRTIVLAHEQDEIANGHSLQKFGSVSAQILDEKSLLDQLEQSSVWPGCAEDETASAPVFKIKNCKVDLSGHTFIAGDGHEVHLTRAETAMLRAFVCNPRRVLSRDQLRRAVVGYGAQPYDRNIDMLISRLRRKVEADSKSPQLILTAPGIGYKLAVRPQREEEVASPPPFAVEGQGDAQKRFDQLRAAAGSPHSQLEGRKVNVEELQRKLELKAELAQLHARVDPASDHSAMDQSDDLRVA